MLWCPVLIQKELDLLLQAPLPYRISSSHQLCSSSPTWIVGRESQCRSLGCMGEFYVACTLPSSSLVVVR